MARVPNPRKNFQFNIILPGLDPFQAQEVKLPDTELDVVEHGDTNYQVKTAGQKKIGTLQVSKIQPSAGFDLYMRNWMTRIQNQRTGGGELPSQYKVTALVEEYAPDGVSVIERHTYRGVWLFKINGKDFSRMGSANTITQLEFQVDDAD